MKIKILALGVILILFYVVLYSFWYYEYKFILPTPLPDDYIPVSVNQQVGVKEFLSIKADKPRFFHFFNPYCPCSRFNLEHFAELIQMYGADIDFYAVIGSKDLFDKTRSQLTKYQIDIPIIVDKQEMLAKKCGVYATPQAVLLDTEDKLYYRGNYNVARFCTDPKTDFAQKALQAITQNLPPPLFGEMATKSYGCVYDSSEFSPNLLLRIP